MTKFENSNGIIMSRLPQKSSPEWISKLLYPFRSGKNSKFVYFANCALRELVPASVCRARIESLIESGLKQFNRTDILDRVNYYNKLSHPTLLSEDAPQLADHRLGPKAQVYYFDTREFTRYFEPSLRWRHLPGDIIHIPTEPTIVKSRPIAGNNANSILLNLNKVRHFIFVNDTLPFEQKKTRAIFRGKVRNKPKRIDLFTKHFGNPLCNFGDTSSHSTDPDAWKTGKMTIQEQLENKFILAIEGNDVASNLKWILSSNAIAMMPRPEFETWFMEGRLIPDVHYIELAADFSDLEEKIRYYSKHTEAAHAIINQAHEYVQQFQTPQCERLISLLVMRKYFALTN